MSDGLGLGNVVVGSLDGLGDGMSDGLKLGSDVVGSFVGLGEGINDGRGVGIEVGSPVGLQVIHDNVSDTSRTLLVVFPEPYSAQIAVVSGGVLNHLRFASSNTSEPPCSPSMAQLTMEE